jgi:hypothetical protein
MRRTCLTVLFQGITFALVALSGNATGGDNLHSERLPLQRAINPGQSHDGLGFRWFVGWSNGARRQQAEPEPAQGTRIRDLMAN